MTSAISIANISKRFDELKALDKDVKAIVAEAAQFAKDSPEPDPSELYTDVLVEVS